mmetsp:Transcript_20674/g.27893  ORF Transcript_20674/g.27893 Transcript_20674/m.27893 type:complete len:146 (+) Transcript_20674:3-440(+)
MIDLGQCVQFEPEVKLGFARLICALVLPESPESNALIADAIVSMGVRSARMDKEFLAFVCRNILTGMKLEWLQDGYSGRMWARDSILVQPIEVLFITRVSSLLRGFGLFLCENVDVAQAWAPWAERWLRESGESVSSETTSPGQK